MAVAVTRSRLKAHAPEFIKPRKPKTLVYGPSGVGKTWMTLDFPGLYFIDSEEGATQPEYRQKLISSGGLYLGPDDGAGSLPEVIEQVRALATEQHDRRTLVVDTATKLFGNGIAREAERLSDAGKKNEFGADRRPAVSQMRQLVYWINRLDMNVILICGEVPEWGTDNKGDRMQIGTTFDCWPRLEYELDLVFHVSRQGSSRVGRVRKSRIAAFPLGGPVLPWSYQDFAERYGMDVLEEQSKPIILANDDQLAEINRLLQVIKLEDGTVDKWLAAADVSAWSEMPEERVAKAIVHLQSLIAPPVSVAAK